MFTNMTPLDPGDLQGLYDKFVPGNRPKEVLNSMRIAREGPLEVYRKSKATQQSEYRPNYVFLLNDCMVFGRDVRSAIHGDYSSHPAPPVAFKMVDGKKVWDPKGNLSKQQHELLQQFRQKLAKKGLTDDEKRWLDDGCCLRYLRARQWDLNKSFAMLENTLKFRSEVKPWEVKAQDIKADIERGGMYLHPTARDREGRPVVYMRPRLEADSPENKVKIFMWVVEKAIASMDTETSGVEKMTWIIDLQGTKFEMSKMSEMTKVSRDIINLLQDNYPERLGLVILVHPPSVFSTLFRVIRGFIDPVTRRKIIFIRNEEELRKLRGYFEEDQLEVEYGGKNEFQFAYADE